MITLNSTLQTAQDGDTHQPIISLVSNSFTESFPFEGSAFNELTADETNPDIVEHSTGLLAAVVNRGNDIILLVTDTDKTEWTEYTIYAGSGANTPCLCELDNGDLGIIFINSTYDIYYLIVGIDGTVGTSATLINNYTTWINSPSVELLANGTFILVYAYKNGSNEYSISKRTSANFTTWSSVTAIIPSGLSNLLRMDNTHIRQLASGEIFLLFDYVDELQDESELVNCYLLRSSDNGGTWTTPESITSYTVFGTSGKNPVVAERSDGTALITFNEEKGVLRINEDTTGWDVNTDGGTSNISYNPSNNKLYVTHDYVSVGTKIIEGFTVIDVATWTIDKTYTYISSPAINDIFKSAHTNVFRDISDGTYFVGSMEKTVMVIDTVGDTITNYQFNDDDAGYSLTANVDALYAGSTTQAGIWSTWVDASTDKLYVLFLDAYLYHQIIILGWIDLTELPDAITGKYTWNEIFTTTFSGYSSQRFLYSIDAIHIDTSANIVTIGGESSGLGGEGGRILVYDLVSGGQLYSFYFQDLPGMAYWGASYCTHHDGHIYGDINYQSAYENGDRYGLLDINLSTGSIRYHRPSWATLDNYNLTSAIDIGDNRLLMSSILYGYTIFDRSSETWTLYSDDTLPGLGEGSGGESWWQPAYDSVNDIIFGCYEGTAVGGVVAFPESGNFAQLQYILGTSPPSWVFGSANILVNGYTASMPAAVIDSDDSLWALWTHLHSEEQSLYWDQESVSKDLTSYIVNSPVSVSWEVDSIATLDFTLSHGHLFDPSNSMSILAPFLKKGMKIIYKLGETISSVDYFQEQGTFIIKNTSLKYSRGAYPTIQVSCEDMSMLWSETNVLVTDHYDGASPESIISDLLQDHGGLEVAEIDMPTIADSHTLSHQFIDQTLRDMLDLILEHFNYFLLINQDGTASARFIDLSKATDHTYTGKIINFTPDDSFSTFTNRVVCRGEGDYFIEVLYDMESVGVLSGTVTPFGGTEVKRVWYSEDHDRTCRDPILEVIISIREFELFLIKGGGTEYISAVDSEEHYVDITIESPDLTGVLIALAASIIATGVAAIGCGYPAPPCGPYIYALSIETQLLGYLLGAFAQYEYNIYAKPIGHEKQTFQAEANDAISQRELDGRIISVEIEDSFCYTVQRCQIVANNELEVIQAQQKRVSFTKPAHLQDEIGDMLKINHVYTNLPINIFLTKLNRTYQKGNGVFDAIEGWRV